ncbi:hypothetical protein [Helicobacter pylori]|uniref:hypothetical protein n=1 Tax=Helicobacter pylori TaxID=210 RepID=UPI000BEA6C99|nr:hypothetical protein [Helicobacter pylori]PDX24852.1 hypothetical protein BB459_00550 [Helicobacter pylori]
MRKIDRVRGLELLLWYSEQMLHSAQALRLDADEILVSAHKLRAVIQELKKTRQIKKKQEIND